MRKFSWAGVRIQKVVRGFLSKCDFRRVRGRAFLKEVVVPAAITIQSVYHGMKGRMVYREVAHAYWMQTEAVPAVRFMQRFYRGHLGRCQVLELREMHRQAAVLQRVVRGRKMRKWYAFVMFVQKKNAMAVLIQSHVRGSIARDIFERRMNKKYRLEVVLPCCLMVQTIWRGHAIRRKAERRKKEYFAALAIQQPWKRRCKRVHMQIRWRAMRRQYEDCNADIVQRALRCYAARKLVVQLRDEREGVQHKATLKMQSAWRKYKNGIRFTLLREAWEVQQSGEILTECQEDKEGIDDDLDDVRDDGKRIRKCRKNAIHRIRELRDFQWTSERRLPEVEAEIEKLTEEDIEKGWAEAFETEWDILSSSLEMSEEEVLGKKIQIREYDEEILLLDLELEDLEVDMDENGTREVEELEHLRCIEIQRGAFPPPGIVCSAMMPFFKSDPFVHLPYSIRCTVYILPVVLSVYFASVDPLHYTHWTPHPSLPFFLHVPSCLHIPSCSVLPSHSFLPAFTFLPSFLHISSFLPSHSFLPSFLLSHSVLSSFTFLPSSPPPQGMKRAHEQKTKMVRL
jgi:abnormal spindle-like microcephaly-associated protein